MSTAWCCCYSHFCSHCCCHCYCLKGRLDWGAHRGHIGGGGAGGRWLAYVLCSIYLKHALNNQYLICHLFCFVIRCGGFRNFLLRQRNAFCGFFFLRALLALLQRRKIRMWYKVYKFLYCIAQNTKIDGQRLPGLRIVLITHFTLFIAEERCFFIRSCL